MTNRMMLLSLVGLSAIGLVAFAAWAGDEHEEEVSLEQVPAAVKATILRESAGGKITEIERETKNGKTSYEAEFLRDGQEIEIKIAPDGTL
ncbi:MAG: PepSY domain-containing protein, partial [Planctomycetota bacterium]